MSEKKRKVILDVDTGSDDALAIMCALLSPELDVIGICSVNGNRPLPNTTENTLRVVEMLGKDVPVIKGCPTPIATTLDPIRGLRQRPDDAYDENGNMVTYHSEYLPLPPATKKPLEGTNAVCWYIDTLMNATEKLTIVMVGPLTNFAVALRAQPEIVKNVEEIVIMGGGQATFNSTGASEFNMFIDPEAAGIVFNCGAKITLMPLEATHKALMRPVHRDYFKSWGTLAGDLVASAITDELEAYNVIQPLHEPDIAPIHDALCVLYLLDPTVITKMEFLRVDVVCDGIADGQTVMDTRYYTDAPRNVHVCLDADEEKIVKLMLEVLSRAR